MADAGIRSPFALLQDAAKQLLLIATERLHPGGALPYVPARIFGWISFASSFLLKAVYSGAVAEADAQEVVGLIQNVIYCLANSSPDKQHLGIRSHLLSPRSGARCFAN